MRLRTIGFICAMMGAAAVSFADDPALPDGYAPIDWIESTGGQYIDTGVNAGANTTIDMSFGRCVYVNESTLFGKDVWNPHGWLFIMQNGHFRFFGAKGEEPGAKWNLIAKDNTEECDYRFTLGADDKVRMFGADGKELCALATDRSAASHHPLWLFKCNNRHGKPGGKFRLYSAKIGTDEGETLRDFVPARRMGDRAVGLYDRVTKRFFANAGTGAFLASDDPLPRGRRWTLARAREWGRANPWYCGFNHVPANAINDVEIWAKETFSPELIRSEFKLATGLGFNCVRIFLQYKVYEADPVWFREAFERYVKLADEAKLKVMPVLFDDCSFWPATDPQLGKQTDPLPGWGMWGWVPSPGHTMVVDYRTHGALEKYVKDIISRYKDDPRIFIWDLYNEPTNSMRDHKLRRYSIDLMHKCFRWAREIAPSQPLTVACFRPVDPVFDKIAMAESDIITFHFYGNAAGTRKKIAEMSVAGRPIICTEWLFRPSGCDVPNILCIYKETGIGCMLWGLVNGKAQTHLPNGEFTPNFKGPWKHDLFHSDHRPYNTRDLELIREAIGTASKQP